jgi:O-acetyl-ADP-ribose deacetylase
MLQSISKPDMQKTVEEFVLRSGQRVQVVQGDLTEERVDAIVNAANAGLMHGGGVAGAIARRGGSQIQEESEAWVREHGPVNHAEPAYTSGGRLNCRYVIHAVGPVWGEGEEDAKLAVTVSGALRRADSLGVRSIAFPAISTGIFGFPKGRAARLIWEAIRDYFKQNPGSVIELVRLTLFDQEMVGTFLEAIRSADE